MKTLVHFLASASVIGVSVAALAGNAVGIHPEEAIPDNLPRLTSPGPYDDMVKQLQEKLNQLGFAAGPVNGDFGEKTQAALAQFQRANLLPASGGLDDATLKELGLQRPAEGGNAAAGGSAPQQQSE